MRPGVRKFLAVLGVGLVFTLGMVAGAAVTIHVVRHRAENLLTEGGGDLAVERFARTLADKLRADASQREKIAVTLRSAHGEIREIRREVTPRVRDIYQRAVGQIRAALRPEQVSRFDEMVAKQQERLHLNDNLPSTANPTPIPGPSASPGPSQT